MKNHMAFKFLAFALCVVMLALALVSGFLIVQATRLQIYETDDVQQLIPDVQDDVLETAAKQIAGRYVEQTFSNLTGSFAERELQYIEMPLWMNNYIGAYTVIDTGGNMVAIKYSSEQASLLHSEWEVSVEYPVMAKTRAEADARFGTNYLDEYFLHANKEDIIAPGDNPDAEQDEDWMLIRHYRSDVYTVILYLQPDVLFGTKLRAEDVLTGLHTWRYHLIGALIGAIVLFLAGLVYLCCAAGRSPGTDEVRPGGLNRMPLDLYAVLLAGAGVGLAGLEMVLVSYLSRNVGGAALLALIGLVICALPVCWPVALAAQSKVGGGWWWKHTVIGWTVCTLWRLLKLVPGAAVKAARMIREGYTVFMRVFTKWVKAVAGFVWKITKWSWVNGCAACLWLFRSCGKALKWLLAWLGRIWRWIADRTGKAFSLLPLTWQWLLTCLVMAVALGLALVIWIAKENAAPLIVVALICMFVILYAAQSFGILLDSAKRMRSGDLETKVSEQFLTGPFLDFAGELNALADVAVVAAQKQMKSERMKTELITNVSHDIKTPLTSIINYVDLLQKPHSEEAEQEYLEVLGRQSLRLKKLIDDLMEMSKATTGNLAVDIAQVNAVEAVNQALGEFADKLTAANLTPVFNQPAEQVMMLADGRLAWRVLSNLLSNAVKYALPGTRLYIDLTRQEGKVLISLKNISREPLNVDAEELMERFVRGDVSRNTEGSGLGLNIAKSLMEVQQGRLVLTVDGDLFKATLIFPEGAVRS